MNTPHDVASGGTPEAPGKATWKRLRAAFAGALVLGPADRARFLDETLGQDSELRAEVEELLRRESDPEVLRAPWRADLGALDPGTAVPGQRIGPYELERVIG